MTQRIKSDYYDVDYFLSSACPGHKKVIEMGEPAKTPVFAEALEIMPLSPGMRVLDFGCGRGDFLYHMVTEHQVSAVGLDYSAAAVTLSHRTFAKLGEDSRKRAAAVRGVGPAMPFPDSSFDSIFMLDVIEHLYQDELESVLSELRRCLRVGGHLVIHTMNRLHYDVGWACYTYFLVSLYRLLSRRQRPSRNPRNSEELVAHVNEQDPQSLRSNLKRAGFDSVDIRLMNLWIPRNDFRHYIGRLIFDLWPINRLWPLNQVFSHSIFALAQK